MIRFACPQCGKRLKVIEDRAGLPVLCRRCGEQCVVPASAAAEGDAAVEGSPRQETDLRRAANQQRPVSVSGQENSVLRRHVTGSFPADGVSTPLAREHASV